MVYLKGDGAAYRLQVLSREQMKLKLLTDISVDMTVCQIEGWDQLEYVRDLHRLIGSFAGCGGGRD